MVGTYSTGAYGSVDGTYGALTVAEEYIIVLLEAAMTMQHIEGGGGLLTLIEGSGG